MADHGTRTLLPIPSSYLSVVENSYTAAPMPSGNAYSSQIAFLESVTSGEPTSNPTTGQLWPRGAV